ncbi:MAG: hypothetical protein DRN26_05930 [Thermoplasmata archaeon]|nr:MAG: hypothetical protein DRN26_05930 [Thermoplasmata archaeon]
MSSRGVLAFIILILALVPLTGCIEMNHEEESSGKLFVGAYMDYHMFLAINMSAGAMETSSSVEGRLHIEVIDENETHYKVLYEYYKENNSETPENSTIKWIPKGKPIFISERNWTNVSEEEIIFNGTNITCQKYVFKNETVEEIYWVYDEIPIKIIYNLQTTLGSVAYTWTYKYELIDTNIIELP